MTRTKESERTRLRQFRDAHPGYYSSICKRYRANNPGASYASQRKWRQENPHKWKAERQAQSAIKKGLLVRQPCEVCADPNSHAHHPDYSKPLDVKWLCNTHHHNQHRTD